MALGKYSPTVFARYAADQNWHRKEAILGDGVADGEGFDSYGYHVQSGQDRAGYTEHDYLVTEGLYLATLDQWTLPLPKQGSMLNRSVDVIMRDNTDVMIDGVVVRNDREHPFVTIIRLVDGRRVRACDCYYQEA